jgi:hypothetical protein
MRLVTLIPPDHVDERKAACEVVLTEIAQHAERLLVRAAPH